MLPRIRKLLQIVRWCPFSLFWCFFFHKYCESGTIHCFWAWRFLPSSVQWEEILEKFVIRHFLYSFMLLLVNFITFSFKTERLSSCFWREVAFVWLLFTVICKEFDLPVGIKPMLKECFWSWLCVLKCFVFVSVMFLNVDIVKRTIDGKVILAVFSLTLVWSIHKYLWKIE